jgi:hypothetical protein
VLPGSPEIHQIPEFPNCALLPRKWQWLNDDAYWLIDRVHSGLAVARWSNCEHPELIGLCTDCIQVIVIVPKHLIHFAGRKQSRPAHIFLCMLAYYVEWHLWAPLLFEDEELLQDRRRGDPVLPASRSRPKRASKRTAEGLPVHSFATLLAELGNRSRVTYGLKSDAFTPRFQQVPAPNPLQARAYELLNLLPVAGN